MTVAWQTLTLRSKGQWSRSYGYQMRCRGGYVCRSDCFGFECNMTRLCYERNVRLSVCYVGGLWSHSTIRSRNRNMTGYVFVLATCSMLKPIRIVVSCDPELHQCGIYKTVGVLRFGAHPTARMSRYLSMCCASCTVLLYADKWYSTVLFFSSLRLHSSITVFRMLSSSIIYTSLFHFHLKTYLFHKSFPS